MTRISWIDKATVKRQMTVKGSHFEKNGQYNVYENIPCHLSENNLTGAHENRKVKSVDYDFKLFCSPEYKIELNDVIEVTTAGGQNFKVYAGRSRVYAKTCQTKCYFTPVAIEVA